MSMSIIMLFSVMAASPCVDVATRYCNTPVLSGCVMCKGQCLALDAGALADKTMEWRYVKNIPCIYKNVRQSHLNR